MDEEKYQRIYKEIKNVGKMGDGKEYSIKEGMLYKKKNDGKMIRIVRKHEWGGIMYMMHDHPTAGHFGIKVTRG